MLAQAMYGVVQLAGLPWMSCQGGTQDDSERRLALLTRRHHITSVRGKDVPALFAPKTPGNLLFDLHHARSAALLSKGTDVGFAAFPLTEDELYHAVLVI